MVPTQRLRKNKTFHELWLWACDQYSNAKTWVFPKCLNCHMELHVPTEATHGCAIILHCSFSPAPSHLQFITLTWVHTLPSLSSFLNNHTLLSMRLQIDFQIKIFSPGFNNLAERWVIIPNSTRIGYIVFNKTSEQGWLWNSFQEG